MGTEYAHAWCRAETGWVGYRALAEATTRHQGFIDTYLTGVVYPARFLVLVQSVVAVRTVASWAGVLLRRRRVSGAGGRGTRVA